MHPTASLPTAPADSGTHPCGQSEAAHAGAASAALMNRVGRVLQDLNAGREVTDAELLAHEADCRHLSMQCHGRWEQFGDRVERDNAHFWLHQADQARRCLSPSYKAAKEAQIQQAIAEGAGCYFMDQADAARARLEGRAAA